MARYTEARCKLCRKTGQKLFLKGDKCYLKCILDKKERQKRPGEHGDKRTKFSDYGIRLREKQMARYMTGVQEKQFRNLFKKAARTKGMSGMNFLLLLETRLDNVAYRLGFASSKAQARQLVSHGHVKVNNRRVNIPSYRLKPGDTVSVSPKMRENVVVKNGLESGAKRGLPSWLTLDSATLNGKIVNLPSREEMSFPVAEQLIVEFYSR